MFKTKEWRRRFAVFIAALIVLMGMVQPSYAAGTANVTGKLTQGGNPLAGIGFSIQDTAAGNWYDATSDPQGNFSFQLPDGTFNLQGVWVQADNKWYPQTQSITVAGGVLTGSFNIDLPTLASTLNVSGALTKNGQPLSGVTFSVHTSGTNPQWFDATSAADGSFKLALPNGSYTLDGVWVQADNKWYQLSQTFTVAGSLNLPIEVIKGAVAGTVTKDGAALAATTFSIHDSSNNWYNATTDHSGNFSFSNLPDGSYTLDGIWVASEAHWYQLSQNFSVSGGSLSGATTLAVAIQSQTYNVTGTLTKGATALPNVTFSIHTTSGQTSWYDATTDSTGAYKFNLPDGSYTLDGVWMDAEAKWYPTAVNFTVTNGQLVGTTPLNIDVIAANPANVSGIITKKGYNVTDATLSAYTTGANPSWYDAQTDNTGTFRFTLPDGSYQIDGIWVQSEAKWYPEPTAFTVANGKITQPLSPIDLAIVPGNVKGQVVNVTPINNNTFSLHSTGANPVWYSETTDASGNFTFNLPDGDYTVDGIWVAKENNWYPTNINFTVKSGVLVGMSSLLIDLQPKPNVSGTVMNGNTPVSSVSVNITNTDTGDFYATGTDQSGKYGIQLPDGNYVVDSIFTGDYQTINLSQNFSVVKGQLTVNDTAANALDLYYPSVQGVVQDAGGPIANANIVVTNTDTWETTNVTTDANGAFTSDLPDGNYYIESVTTGSTTIFMYSNFTITKHAVIVNNVPQAQFTLTLPVVTVTGDVTANAKLLANATVAYTNLGDFSTGTAVTDASGKFSLRLADGNYRIDSVNSTSLSNIVYLYSNFSVTGGKVTVGGTAQTALHLTLPAALKGTLVNAKKTALVGYTIDIQDANQNWISVQTTTGGAFTVSLPNGSYQVMDVYDPNSNMTPLSMAFSVANGKFTVNGTASATLTITTP